MHVPTAARRAFDTMLALTALATLLALVIRVATTVRFGALVPAPIEGPGLYTIWKVQHGYPAYEWPTREFFALTLYNFLFYQSYAQMLSLLGVREVWLPVAAKLVTVMFAGAGAIVQYVTAAAILKRRGIRPNAAVLATFAFVTWFGAGFIGPWAVFARPDVPACVFALAGFACCASCVDGRSPARLIAAGLLFYLAWAFKQSAVAMLAGVCLYFLAVRRSIRDVSLVSVPFGAMAGLTIALGGAAYRYNILVAPGIAQGFEWWTSWFYLRGVFLPNAPVWAAVAFAASTAIVARRRPDAWPVGRDLASLFACTIAVTFIMGVILMAKIGSSLNHAFEFWVTSALLASIVGSALMASSSSSNASPRIYALSSALLAVPLIFTAAHLAGSERVIRILGLSASVERMRLGSERVYAARARLHDRLRDLPRPVHIDDELLAQPWYANGNRYPAIVLDHVFYDAAGAKNLLERGGVLSLVDRRYFGTVVAFVPPYYVFRAAQSAGYVEVDRLPWFADAEAVVLVRSAAPDPDQIKRPTRRRTP
jgi:hypothetical protein